MQCFGPYQFAYVPGPGARDVMLFFVIICLAAFASGKRVAWYCADVSRPAYAGAERVLCAPCGAACWRLPPAAHSQCEAAIGCSAGEASQVRICCPREFFDGA
eukprot:12847523-Alexandrium_andersonii.AAC.1